MTETAIVILNFNGRSFLRQFLPSVIQHSDNAQIVVADNGSTDDSVTLLKKEFPQVRLIEVGTNLGFCGGYNYALKKIEAHFYVLLNSDVEVTPGWLSPIIDLLKSNPKVAAVQPKILSFHHRDEFEYAGAGGGFIDTLGYPFCRGRLFQSLEKDQGQYDDTVPVFWATGACVTVRSSLFHQLNGLDEDFFAHMEEIDLCWKLHRLGYEIHYQGKSKVYHVGGGTLSKSNPRKTYLNFRNGLSLLFKHQSIAGLLWKFPVRMILDWLAAIRFLLTGSGKDAWMVLKAHFNFFKKINREWKKRIETQSMLRNFSASPIYSQSIVVDYYLKGKRTFRELNF